MTTVYADCSTSEGQRKAAEFFYRIDRAHKARGLSSPISYGKDRPDSLRPPRGRAPRPATNARMTGSRRAQSTTAGSPRGTRAPPDDDPHDTGPPRGRPPRHISEVLRGWLDRYNRTAAGAGFEPHERLELFLSLPTGEQAYYFAQLGEHERQERILDGDLLEEPPQRPPKALGRAPRSDSFRPSVRGSRDGDVFEQIAPPEYWEALTGDHVPVDGLVRCPMPGHEDIHPSCVVYPEPGRGWWCPVCDAGGSAIDLAEAITGIRSRGRGYLRLREWVAERLLNTPTRSTT